MGRHCHDRVNAAPPRARRPRCPVRRVAGATIAFIAFTWLELVAPSGADPRTLAIAALVYTVVRRRVSGTSPDRNPGFVSPRRSTRTTGSSAAIAPVDVVAADAVGDGGRNPGARRRPTALAAGAPVRSRAGRGLTAFVVAMIATVSYDGASGTELWATFDRRSAAGDLVRTLCAARLRGGDRRRILGGVVGGRAPGRRRRDRAPGGQTFRPHTGAHRLAYAVAHYVTLVLFEGQLLLFTLSDPFGRGWNLFGNGGLARQLLPLARGGVVPPGHRHRRGTHRRCGARPRPGPGRLRRGSCGSHPVCNAGAHGRTHVPRSLHPGGLRGAHSERPLAHRPPRGLGRAAPLRAADRAGRRWRALGRTQGQGEAFRAGAAPGLSTAEWKGVAPYYRSHHERWMPRRPS